MGDRVHATFTLGGHIETIADCEELVEAIAAEGVTDSERDEFITDIEEAKTALRFAVENQLEPKFYDNECNYGTFDSVESAVSLTEGLAAYICWDAGGGFPAGMKTITPDGLVFSSEGNGDPTITLSELVEARKADDVLEAIDAIIAKANKAGGVEMPSFTVSPAVAAWLKIFGNRAA